MGFVVIQARPHGASVEDFAVDALRRIRAVGINWVVLDGLGSVEDTESPEGFRILGIRRILVMVKLSKFCEAQVCSRSDGSENSGQDALCLRQSASPS